MELAGQMNAASHLGGSRKTKSTERRKEMWKWVGIHLDGKLYYSQSKNKGQNDMQPFASSGVERIKVKVR